MNSPGAGPGETLVAIVAGALAAVLVCMYGAAVLAAALAGGHVHGHPLAVLSAFGHFNDPSAAWHTHVGSPAGYWVLQAVGVLAGVAIIAGVTALVVRMGKSRRARWDGAADARGLANRAQVKAAAGEKQLLKRAKTLRPSLDHPTAKDVGFRIGVSRGVPVWVSVEDSVLLVGPPRSGKGVGYVINLILDAPGAVVTTSSRNDNVKYAIKQKINDGRPVAVFDAEGMADGIPGVLRWSLTSGCEDPEVATARAVALVGNDGDGDQTGAYFAAYKRDVAQCLLHAAALSGGGAPAIREWSRSRVNAADAVQVLLDHPDAEPGWADDLSALIDGDGEQIENNWSSFQMLFSALRTPRGLAAVTPEDGQELNIRQFLNDRGCLFLLGSRKQAKTSGRLVSALIEEVVRVAQLMAAASPGSRLDPPMALVLDEASNFVVPSLPEILSAGGGSGLTPFICLQDPAQAEEIWGKPAADAVQGNAIVMILLGGATNTKFLGDYSVLLGEVEVTDQSLSYTGRDNIPGYNQQKRDRRVLTESQLRELPEKHGIVLHRRSKGIYLQSHPFFERDDAKSIRQGAQEIDGQVRDAILERLDRTMPLEALTAPQTARDAVTAPATGTNSAGGADEWLAAYDELVADGE